MRRLLGAAASLGAGYLVGTLPSAEIVTRLATRGQVDIRRVGTGNPGAANVAGVLGKKWGAVVMALDVAKGFAGARLGGKFAGDPGLHVGGPASVAGHCFPVWRRFEGGKGVATSGGQVFATFPLYFPVDAAVAATTARLLNQRQAFAATEAASFTWILFSFVWWRRRLPNPGGCAPSVGLPLAALATSAIVRYRFLQTNQQVEQWRAAQDDELRGPTLER
ncbi:MAG: glycerol-3-phosphate acyltransferase [Acidimicrobiales bacterium]